MGWDADRYDAQFGFVTQHGHDLVSLLEPRPGESIVDLGCGTATLTMLIARAGAHVLGVDADPTMIARGRAENPGVQLRLMDARSFVVAEPVDAVFSNAVLHWIPEPDQARVLAGVRLALAGGGRFVAEMGAAGNVTALIAAGARARSALGLPPVAAPWVFPTLSEQANRLTSAGFQVRLLEQFSRPTPLSGADTAADWVRMFGGYLLADVSRPVQAELLARVDEEAVGQLRTADGRWWADYVRLRWWVSAGPL